MNFALFDIHPLSDGIKAGFAFFRVFRVFRGYGLQFFA